MLTQKINRQSILKLKEKIHSLHKKVNPKWITLIMPIVSIPYYLFAIYKDIIATKKNSNNNDVNKKERKQLQLIMDVKNLIVSLIDTTLAICAFFITGSLILIAGAIKKSLDCSLDIGMAFYNRLFGYGRNEALLVHHLSENIKTTIRQHQPLPKYQIKALTKHVNSVHQLNANLINKIHNALLCTIGLVGMALEFTPAAHIGTMMLTGLSTYSLLDYLGSNPLRWLISGINNQFDKPFSKVSEKEVINKLSKENNQHIYTTTMHSTFTDIFNLFGKHNTQKAQSMARNIAQAQRAVHDDEKVSVDNFSENGKLLRAFHCPYHQPHSPIG